MKHLCFSIAIIFITLGSIQISYGQDSNRIQIENPENLMPREYEIREVSVTGLVTGRESYLISSSGLRVGETITIPGDDISNAIKQIYRTSLFSDVQIFYERLSGDGVNIQIAVEEQPRLGQYEIEGVRRSHRRDLRERINLVSGLAVTNSVRSQALNTIKRYYAQEGYWGTQVEIVEQPNEANPNRVDLIFNVDRGERTKVREINFEGNEHFSDRRLRKSFGTIKQDRWWRIFKRHVYTEEEFEEGIANLKQFYRDNGFRDIRVLSDSVYIDDWRSKEGVHFDITVSEGPQYKVRNISWDGNTVYSDEQLTQALGFQRGDIFNATKFDQNLNFRQDDADVSSLYQNIGYLFFNVSEDIRVVGEDSLDIHFEIVENEIATIRNVTFTGNTKTHDDVVRRNLRTVPGNTYSRSAIVRTIRELGQLGYFTPEGITPDVRPNPEERTVDIEFGLDETQGSDNFEFSGGFGGRQIGVILAARVNFNNFSVQRMFEPGGWDPIPTGDGQRLSLGVQVTGSGFQSYNFSFTEPWLRGRPTSLGVSLSYDLLNYGRQRNRFFSPVQQGSTANQRNELISASVSLGRRLQWPDDFFSQRTVLTYNHFNVAGFGQIFDDGRADLLTVRQELERNSTDNPISPSTGSKFNISGEIALPIPSFAQFYKLKTSYQHHATIVGRLVLSSTVDYGYMGYFTESNRSNFQRFFLGGTELQQRQSFTNDNINMRGFPGGIGGQISPLDDFRNQIGGRAFSKYSLELRYPAVRSEQLQLIPYAFVDAGNTFDGMTSFDPFNVKRAAGFGARIFLPILGLVDLSYGYRLDGTDPHSQNQSGLQAGEWEFLFNIGAPF
ncbi:outer membrane protein assembly factor BamA [Rhodohalobacter sp. SW132]|nr:outer membrane protein assembly factor BamA [Rhodohalobacter sp. SW132]